MNSAANFHFFRARFLLRSFIFTFPAPSERLSFDHCSVDHADSRAKLHRPYSSVIRRSNAQRFNLSAINQRTIQKRAKQQGNNEV
jgi:hypothetical protein